MPQHQPASNLPQAPSPDSQKAAAAAAAPISPSRTSLRQATQRPPCLHAKAIPTCLLLQTPTAAVSSYSTQPIPSNLPTAKIGPSFLLSTPPFSDTASPSHLTEPSFLPTRGPLATAFNNPSPSCSSSPTFTTTNYSPSQAETPAALISSYPSLTKPDPQGHLILPISLSTEREKSISLSKTERKLSFSL